MWQIINKWHRRFGIVSAVFVIVLVVTGFMLNHTDVFNLDKLYIKNRLLLDIYNIHPPQEPVGFRIGLHWISKLGNRIYFDKQEISDEVNELLGAVSVDNEIAVAVDNRIILMDPEGRIIEHLGGGEGVPNDMRSIGITDGSLVVLASDKKYLVDLMSLEWHTASSVDAVAWSKAEKLPDHLLNHLLQLYRGKGLSLERVMLDIHSGRLFGSPGIFIIDLMALVFLVLAVTGIWMWCKRW